LDQLVLQSEDMVVSLLDQNKMKPTLPKLSIKR